MTLRGCALHTYRHPVTTPSSHCPCRAPRSSSTLATSTTTTSASPLDVSTLLVPRCFHTALLRSFFLKDLDHRHFSHASLCRLIVGFFANLRRRAQPAEHYNPTARPHGHTSLVFTQPPRGPPTHSSIHPTSRLPLAAASLSHVRLAASDHQCLSLPTRNCRSVPASHTA